MQTKISVPRAFLWHQVHWYRRWWCSWLNIMSCNMTKPTKWLCALRSLRSATSLCIHWVAKDPRLLHADSKYSDQTGWMPRLIRVFAGCTVILLVLSCHGSYGFFCLHTFPWSLNFSHSMTKPTKWPVCPANSDQPGQPPSLISLRCLHEETHCP